MIPSSRPELSPEMELLGLDPSGPKVVAIGGGHGLAAALEAVQGYASSITAVVSVADDGGSSGRLTARIGVPPPGDIRRCLLALTPEPSIWSELFAFRFEGGPDDPADLDAHDVGGHALGNLILAALADLAGDFAGAVRRAGELLGAVGTVVPASEEAIRLAAVVGGRRVDGQVAVARARGGVERLLLGPQNVSAHPDAVAAIEAADQVILGPGSLFTSVIAALSVPGITEAINRSHASVVIVLNLVTQDGETLGLTGPDHVAAVHHHAGLLRPGGIVAHRGPLQVPEGLGAVEIEGDEAMDMGWDVTWDDVADPEAPWPAHDPMKLGRVLAKLA